MTTQNTTTPRNIYEMITERITEQLAAGIVPWQCPWKGGFAPAISYRSRKPYSFLNQLLLGKPGEWLTWNEIQSLGGRVKKGAKSRFCVWTQTYTKAVEVPASEDAAADETKTMMEERRALKWYKVFHLDDTEGIPSKLEVVEPRNDLNPIDAAEAVITGYLNREPGLRFQNDKPSPQAYYSPDLDEVVVPMLNQYEIAEEYYSTTFHELTHSTMTEKRCNRKSENKRAAFGGADYSREELVAEMGAAMLCSSAGIDCERAFKNSVAYIGNWLKALRNDVRMIAWAAPKAEAAARYILNENK